MQLAELSSERSRTSKRIARVSRELCREQASGDALSSPPRDRDDPRRAYDRARMASADLQRGLSELHRNAHAYRSALEQLDAARRNALGEPDFMAEHAELRR